MANDFDAIDASASADILAVMGQDVTFTGTVGTVSTRAYLGSYQAWANGVSDLTEKRRHCLLKLADVGTPKRGDTVTDSDATVWTLTVEREESDEVIADWTVEATP